MLLELWVCYVCHYRFWVVFKLTMSLFIAKKTTHIVKDCNVALVAKNISLILAYPFISYNSSTLLMIIVPDHLYYPAFLLQKTAAD